MGGCNFGDNLHINLNQNITERKFMFFDEKLLKSSDFYYLEPGLYPCFTAIVETINNLNQEINNQSESCITIKLSRRTQKVEIYIENERSGLAFFSTDLGNFLELFFAMNLV